MGADAATHRLAAIISGDVAGYSRMIATNEALAVRLINSYREEIELLVRQPVGRLEEGTRSLDRADGASAPRRRAAVTLAPRSWSEIGHST